jgi:uncharacterized protein
MPRCLVVAHDGTDDAAQARRLAARLAHLELIRPMVERGEPIAGGAILDDAGRMIGSAVFVEFATRAELDAWLERDPYAVGAVWQRIEVEPFRLAVPAARA